MAAGEESRLNASVTLRVRMSAHDAHYGGDLVDGARILGLFGDVATELLIRSDGDEGLFAAYDLVEFRAPVHAGDYIEASGRIVRFGRTSRTMEFEARKVIAPRPDLSPSAADVLPEPVVVVRARGTCVVPHEHQRLRADAHGDPTTVEKRSAASGSAPQWAQPTGAPDEHQRLRADAHGDPTTVEKRDMSEADAEAR